MRTRTKIAAVAGLCAVMTLAGLGLAAVLFQLDVSNTMSLTATLGLQLRDNETNIITSYAWGTFDHLQLKTMCSEIGDGRTWLWNVGNGNANVTWTSTCPTGWLIWIENDNGSWATGAYRTIAAGKGLQIRIQMKELSAIGGQPYAFALSFKQEG